MKSKYLLTICLCLFWTVAAFGQQFPLIGTIEFYGLRTVDAKELSSVLKIKIGDDAIAAIKAKEENQRLLKSIANVEAASISLICCDDLSGKSILYVGIREKGTADLTFRPSPKDKINLPENILQIRKEFQKAFMKSVEEKNFAEEDSEGNAFYGNKDLRRIQQSFVSLAVQNKKILRKILRQSADAEQRASAVEIIAYHPDKKSVIRDLIFAATDNDDRVRNRATRSLIVIANYANTNPKLKIVIPAADFVRMLDSVEWTDRNKSLGVIDALSKKREKNLLKSLKLNALDSLAEMARWKNPGHSQAAFAILGRIGDFSEDEVVALWKSENREQEIRKILEKIKKP